MSKIKEIKEIEELRKAWKAREDMAALKEDETKRAQAISIGYGLSLALSILKRPFNTRKHMDTKPCKYCNEWGKTSDEINFCAHCGRVLRQ